eukprot:TRINITY_DN47444_c0_g1_i1.p1 TRINITY_DN47444_c0_g1~~TRINITY_DN47444_c0_g1_i1.p1  ORF type:complete len:382 (+),score=34.13 TRINITY_DN47444_c0_g1_i1:123-1268(+)
MFAEQLAGEQPEPGSVQEMYASAKKAVVQAIEWSEFLLGGSLSLCLSANRSPGPDNALHKLKDACVPLYQATAIPPLEMSRANLAVSLTGQLVVICCKLGSGHMGGAALGAVIFIIGNQARCSVQTGQLNAYVAGAGVLGVMDALELLKVIGYDGLHFMTYPSGGVSRSLERLALILAPLSELSGARFAYSSYLRPEMLFQPPAPQHGLPPERLSVPRPPMGDPMQARRLGLLDTSIWTTLGLNQAAGQHGGRPQQQPSSIPPWVGSQPPQSILFEGWPSRPARSAGHGGGSDRGGDVANLNDVDSDVMSVRTYDGGSGHQRPNTGRVHGVPMHAVCSNCQRGFVIGHSGWLGTGRYSRQAFCENCWNEWRNSECLPTETF